MELAAIRRLKELEDENRRLKQMAGIYYLDRQ